MTATYAQDMDLTVKGSNDTTAAPNTNRALDRIEALALFLPTTAVILPAYTMGRSWA